MRKGNVKFEMRNVDDLGVSDHFYISAFRISHFAFLWYTMANHGEEQRPARVSLSQRASLQTEGESWSNH